MRSPARAPGEVLAAYEATYGESPASGYWAHAYDATTLLFSAIESVAVVEDGKLFVDRAALREKLSATAGLSRSPRHARLRRVR